MAESHSEDSPLLGVPDPPSPGERCSSPHWTYNPHEEVPPSPAWVTENASPQGSPQMLHVYPQCSTEKTDGPKPVRSQTSMDSGCDCDPSEGDPPQLGRAIGFSPPCRSQSNVLEPLSPPEPTGNELAQQMSQACQCESLEKCVCASSFSSPGDSKDGVPKSHTDRGELPKVTFRIEGYDNDETRNPRYGLFSSPNVVDTSSQNEDFRVLVKGATMTFPRVTSYSKTGMLSSSSSTASMPMCRICHFPQGEDPDTLISPCRCSGTMQFIHESCLMKWLDVSKSKKTATCELCNYQFNRHKKFRLRHWKLPNCSRLDKILHSIFLLCLIIMATCATITVYCFKQDRFSTKKREDTDLTKSEIVTLTCGVLFFVAFFMAMYVEVKAKDTLYRLFNRFVHLNQTWHIDEYDKQRDIQHAPV